MERAQSARLPAGRLPFTLGGEAAGYVLPEHLKLLAQAGCACGDGGADWPDPANTEPLARALASLGACRYRGEAFDVFAPDAQGLPRGTVIGQVDRGALALLGIAATGVHANGFVRRPDGIHLWVARRAAGVRLDPGKFDHLVAGGIPAGLSPRATLIKEAAEEAGMAEHLAAAARYAGALAYTEIRPEGLRRDLLYVYDFELPEDFTPHAADGEVESFALWPLARVAEALAEGESFKFNVAYVLIDFLVRMGAVPAAAVPGLASLRRDVAEPG